jgi:subtilase family serine protease
MIRFLRPVALLALPVLLAACGSHGASSALPQPGTAGAAGMQNYNMMSNVRENCGPAAPGFARCFSFIRTNAMGGAAPDFTSYGPPDLQSAYKLSGATLGAGQTVAIVDAFDDPTAQSDLNTYRSFYGLSACTGTGKCFRKLNQLGQAKNYPPVNSGWDVEISLDVDMVSAICPKCHILLMEANDNSFANLAATVDEAAKLNANAISNSYGGGEYSGETTDQSHYNHPGHMITASSGDSGFGPQFPAASQFVTAVGGTTLTHSTNKRGWAEVVWPGAGSGCSAFVAKPTWQKDTGCSRRTIADVAADADPSPGVVIVYAGNFYSVGGTSVASPIIASVYALEGNAATLNYGSESYSHPNALFDIIKGSNGSCSPAYLCHGEKGYDGPTGNGTPDGDEAF